MDSVAHGLFGLIRASVAFAQKGCNNPAPLAASTRAAAERAASALTHLLVLQARQVGPVQFNLRSLRDLVREIDGLIARNVTQDSSVIGALWDYRQEIVARMRVHGDGGEVAAETLDLLPAGIAARKVAESAALRPPPPPTGAIHAAEAPAPEPAPAAPPEAAEPTPPEAPTPSPAPEMAGPPSPGTAPTPSAPRIEGDSFRFPEQPKPPAPEPKIVETPALQLTEDLLAGPPPPVSKNRPEEDAAQAEARAKAAERKVVVDGAAPGTGRLYSGIMAIGDAIEGWGKASKPAPKGATA